MDSWFQPRPGTSAPSVANLDGDLDSNVFSEAMQEGIVEEGP